MNNPKSSTKSKSTKQITNLVDVSETTDRKELFWLKGKRRELDVYRVPIKLLYFNIENGRYADKMVQLRAENPGVDIDPRQDKWKETIWKMLKGEYPGTERDVEPFQRLRGDLLDRQQLRPGVVLFDGGVLDGNRRLAALLDLRRSEKNPTRFEYLDAVILDEDVGAEDRWRIEAGVQIGRDEKLAYSPINELLKIKEGLTLFKGRSNPEKEISKVLYGIEEEEIRKDILKIRLIDEYLVFIKKPQAYNEVGDVIERFEEAVKTLEQAKKLGTNPTQIQQIKLAHFAIIRDKLMDNWQMRKVRTAMGAGKAAKGKNERAMKGLLKLGNTSQEFREGLAIKSPNSKFKLQNQEVIDGFLDQMDAQEKADKPMQLASNANAHLSQLFETLQKGSLAKNSTFTERLDDLPAALDEIIAVAKKCLSTAKKLQAKSKTKRS
jgi:hypothetical protein